MVLPIEQKDVAIDVSQPAPDPMDQFAELDAHNSWDAPPRALRRPAMLASSAPNTLAWTSPDELAEGLDRRIRAVIDAKPDADPLETLRRAADEARGCRCGEGRGIVWCATRAAISSSP
jgi:hypothetical protein